MILATGFHGLILIRRNHRTLSEASTRVGRDIIYFVKEVEKKCNKKYDIFFSSVLG